MVTAILTALLVVAAIGIVAGIILVLASHFFKVEENETIGFVANSILATPKLTINNGTILDPFNGSGSTGKAVMYENKELQEKIEEAIKFGNMLMLGEATFEERHIASRFINILKGE